MDTSNMLHDMCHNILSESDVKAIIKNRGFSVKETATRSLFENFFLSDTGVEAMMKELSQEEVTLLHLLKFIGKAVDVSIFERIYNQKRSNYSYTFSQRYQSIFKKVQTSLIRRGLLLIAEDKSANKLLQKITKMERWLFKLPEQFIRFLPPLFKSAQTFESTGILNEHVLRQALLGLVNNKHASPLDRDKEYYMNLADDELCMGNHRFSVNRFLDWQRIYWQSKIAFEVKSEQKYYISTQEATNYIFSQLKANEWFLPDQVALPLELFCGGKYASSIARICEECWECGYMVKKVSEQNNYYRLAQDTPQIKSDVDPSSYLEITSDQSLIIKLFTIPFDNLEQLAQISTLQVKRLQLFARPSVLKLGRVLPEIRQQPFIKWLQEHVPVYEQALKTVEHRWGRCIVHQNLMLAKVNDLTLKVALQKALPNAKDLLLLPNDFIAFPRVHLPTVEKVITKAGQVVKKISSD